MIIYLRHLYLTPKSFQNTLPENIRIELEDKLKDEMIELGYIETN